MNFEGSVREQAQPLSPDRSPDRAKWSYATLVRVTPEETQLGDAEAPEAEAKQTGVASSVREMDAGIGSGSLVDERTIAPAGARKDDFQIAKVQLIGLVLVAFLLGSTIGYSICFMQRRSLEQHFQQALEGCRGQDAHGLTSHAAALATLAPPAGQGKHVDHDGHGGGGGEDERTRSAHIQNLSLTVGKLSENIARLQRTSSDCRERLAKERKHLEEERKHKRPFWPPTTAVAPVAPAAAAGRSLKWAFITLAHDGPETWDRLWQVLPLARALQRVSSYPLVVLTNSTTMPDGKTEIYEALVKLNCQVLPVYKLDVPSNLARRDYPSWSVAYWKLQAWNLTQFEKLIWVDSDALITRSIDWLFDRDSMWAQRDDWFCKLNSPLVCSGLMLLFPDRNDFFGLQNHAGTRLEWKHGDQELIAAYFDEVRLRPLNLLSDEEAAFGQCLGTAPTGYVDSDGVPVKGQWSTPAFVHKSGGWGSKNDNFANVCFSHIVWKQYYEVEDATLNVCHFHPLGPFWRQLFCEAVRIVGLSHPESDAYCDDGCWYNGWYGGNSEIHFGEGQLDRNRWCRPVRATSGPDKLSSAKDEELGRPVFKQ